MERIEELYVYMSKVSDTRTSNCMGFAMPLRQRTGLASMYAQET